MNIKLTRKRVVNLELSAHKKKKESKDIPNQIRMLLSNEVLLNNKNAKLFRVRYNLEILIENKANIKLSYEFDFECTEAVTKDLLPSSMIVRSKAPSIAYPYIRSYIETLVSISGMGEVILPTLDFIENPIELDDENDIDDVDSIDSDS